MLVIVSIFNSEKFCLPPNRNNHLMVKSLSFPHHLKDHLISLFAIAIIAFLALSKSLLLSSPVLPKNLVPGLNSINHLLNDISQIRAFFLRYSLPAIHFPDCFITGKARGLSTINAYRLSDLRSLFTSW